MDRTPMWRRYLRLVREDPGADAREEIEHHLEMRARELTARGMDPAAARAEAERRFGDVERVRREMEREDRERLRERGRRDRWGALRQDVGYALRTFRRAPGFAAVAVLTLALGIGGTAAIFSVVHAVLLRPLPYAEPERVVRLVNHWEGSPEADLSPAEFFDFRDGMTTLASLGAYAEGPVNLTGGGTPERLQAGYLSHGVWPALGVRPALGRVFGGAEDVPGGESVAVLSHGFWVRRYGARPGVVGERILLGGEPVTVIGVMPPDFRIPSDLRLGESSDLFLPLGMDRSSVPNRGSHFLEAVGRLRPGVTAEQASEEAARLAAGFVRDYPDDYSAEMRFATSAGPLREAVLGPARPLMLTLLGAVALVLLIACSNLANLLLVRADARRRELAVRAALGASRGRIVRQLLVESLMLATAGGVAGLALAALAVRLFPLVQPPDLPRIAEVRLDGAVLAFTAGVSLLTALLFGLAPALRAARADVQGALREGGRGSVGRGSRRRLRAALVSGEVALAVVLLLGAGLLLRTLAALHAVDPGYRTEGVLTLRLSVPSSDYPEPEQVTAFYRELLRRVEALPGVAEAGAVTNLPLASSLGDLNFRVEGRPIPEGASSPRGDWQAVTPGYFRAVGMRLVRGRGIEPSDDERAPGAIVINQALADAYWPGEDPLGERLLLGGGAGPGWVTVVGIVADVRHASLTEAPKPEMYIPHAQFRFWDSGNPVRSVSLAVRTTGDPLALAGAVRAEVRRLDAELPVAEVRPLAAVRAESVAQPRFASLLLAVFAAVALALAVVGVYGTLAYLVAQRRAEIGVRMALGATAARVAGLVVRQALVMVAVGLVLGSAAALLLARLVRHLLYGVTPTDGVTFAAVPAVLLLAALLASWLPARRAARVEPGVVLRG